MSEANGQFIFNCMDRGIDLIGRRIFFFNDIDEETAAQAIQAIHYMEDISEEGIEVIINTLGGNLYEALALYDVIRSSPCLINTVAMGKVMSAGVIVFAAGDERYSHLHTTFMIHEVAWNTDMEKMSYHKNTTELMETLTDSMIDIFVDRSTLSGKEWRKLKGLQDHFLTASQMLKTGLATDLIKHG